MKSHTDIEQSKKLAEILPIESADMCYIQDLLANCKYGDYKPYIDDLIPAYGQDKIRCWSLAALIEAMPEILIETVKARDGYDGYYYFVTYEEEEIGVPYEKELIDACYEMILRLHEEKLI